MLRFSACIEMMYRELDFYDRFNAAEASGLAAAEFWGWSNKDLEKIKKVKKCINIPIAGMCVDSFNADNARGYRNGIVYSENCDAFVECVKDSVKLAKELEIPNLIVTTGQERKDVSREEQHKNVVSALKEAAPIVERENVTLVLEPLNILVNHKGYYLATSTEGFEIIREVNSPNVKLLFDIYHQQITEGNLLNNILNNIDLIGHFHVADTNGRHEVGTGEINYKNIFNAIESTNYSGFVGLEYSPIAPTTETIRSLFELVRG